MYTRSIDQLMSEMIDPRTGLPLVPLYVRADGSCVWPVMGAAPDDDSDEDDADDTDPDEETDEVDDEDEDDEDDGKKKKSKKRDPDPRDVRMAQLEKRMKAADRRASMAEKRLKEIDDKDKSELQLVTEERDSLKAELDALRKEQRETRLQNEFLSVNSFNWADVSDALTVAERGGYLDDVVDEDGKVDRKALREAVKQLAKDKPYLVVKKDSNDDGEDDGEDDKDDKAPKGTSGTPVGSGRKKTKTARFTEAELRQRYPAL